MASKRVRKHGKRRDPLTDQEARKLFARFAAPMFRAAKSPSQEQSAQRLAQSLWLAMVTGPETEDALFQSLEEFDLDAKDIQVIKDRYYNEMKPSTTKEELRALKTRYRAKKR